jgi:hypothetical protein
MLLSWNDKRRYGSDYKEEIPAPSSMNEYWVTLTDTPVERLYTSAVLDHSIIRRGQQTVGLFRENLTLSLDLPSRASARNRPLEMQSGRANFWTNHSFHDILPE